MPSAIVDVTSSPNAFGPSDRIARLSDLGLQGRLREYRAGGFDRTDVAAWIAWYPEEIPTVNGEFEWIGLRLADLE